MDRFRRDQKIAQVRQFTAEQVCLGRRLGTGVS
jgi:hypothetical protein